MIAVLLVAVLGACQADTILIHTMRGEKIDVNRSDLADFLCVAGVDGKDDFTLMGEQAWQLRDYLERQRADANMTEAVAQSEHWVHLWFEAQWNGDRVELGTYTIYDSGSIGYTESAYSDTLLFYNCGDEVYDKVTEMIKH